MSDNNNVNAYAAEAMYHCVDMQKLLAFLLNVAMGNPCEIEEDEVHGAFRCMKAHDKRNIEQNGNLSDMQKEIEKQKADQFYNELDRKLIEELNRRCAVRIENR